MKRTTRSTTTTGPAEEPAGQTEQRIAAFAEQIGRIAGTLQAKTEGWLDRKTLNDQLASVRDGATALLGHLTAGVEKGKRAASAAAKPSAKTPPAPGPGPSMRRSRGVVDAPGKTHRKPPPPDPQAAAAATQAAKLRTAAPMIKTHRRRGRG
ncbi:MAG: hypothetical protein ABIT71_05970 [Vicinamibacteraceae bacterium]